MRPGTPAPLPIKSLINQQGNVTVLVSRPTGLDFSMPLRLRLAGPVILATILLSAPLAQVASPSHLVADRALVQDDLVVDTFLFDDRWGRTTLVTACGMTPCRLA
jgi:hypothetical protein